MGSRLCASSDNGTPCPVGTVVGLVRLQGTQRTEADSTGVAHENWHWRAHKDTSPGTWRTNFINKRSWNSQHSAWGFASVHKSTVFHSHIPCRAPAIPLWKRFLKVTAQQVCANQHQHRVTCPRSVSSDYHAEFHDWKVVFFRLHADFHEARGTVGGWQRHDRGTAWYVRISL